MCTVGVEQAPCTAGVEISIVHFWDGGNMYCTGNKTNPIESNVAGFLLRQERTGVRPGRPRQNVPRAAGDNSKITGFNRCCGVLATQVISSLCPGSKYDQLVEERIRRWSWPDCPTCPDLCRVGNTNWMGYACSSCWVYRRDSNLQFHQGGASIQSFCWRVIQAQEPHVNLSSCGNNGKGHIIIHVYSLNRLTQILTRY